MNHQHLSHHLT